MNLRKIGAESILTGMIVPIVLVIGTWAFSFIYSSYATQAEVSSLRKSVENIQSDYAPKSEVQSLRDDIKDIKTDVRDVRNYLMPSKQ